MRHNKALTSFLGRHCSLPSSHWQFEMIAGTRKIIISILVRLTAINSTRRRRIYCIENIIGITRGVTVLEDQMILDDYGNLEVLKCKYCIYISEKSGMFKGFQGKKPKLIGQGIYKLKRSQLPTFPSLIVVTAFAHGGEVSIALKTLPSVILIIVN